MWTTWGFCSNASNQRSLWIKGKPFCKEHSFPVAITSRPPLFPPESLHQCCISLLITGSRASSHLLAYTLLCVLLHLLMWGAAWGDSQLDFIWPAGLRRSGHQCQDAGPREGGQKPATSHLFSFKGHCTGCGQMSGRLHLRILFTPRLPTDGFTKFPSLLLLPKASTYE